MKIIRILAVALACVLLSCAFISCDDVDLESIVMPEQDFYDMTVSFQIFDGKGTLIADAVDYNYKGHETPTILNIISDYLAIEIEGGMKCVITDNTLVQIGSGSDGKANIEKGDYWAFAVGVGHDIEKILADTKLQDKTFVNDQKMSDYLVEDGGSFTVVLVKGS